MFIDLGASLVAQTIKYASNAGDPVLKEDLGEGNNALQYCCLEEFHEHECIIINFLLQKKSPFEFI